MCYSRLWNIVGKAYWLQEVNTVWHVYPYTLALTLYYIQLMWIRLFLWRIHSLWVNEPSEIVKQCFECRLSAGVNIVQHGTIPVCPLSHVLHSASKNKTIPVGDILYALKQHILDSQTVWEKKTGFRNWLTCCAKKPVSKSCFAHPGLTRHLWSLGNWYYSLSMKYYQSIPNFLIWQSDSPAVFTELRPNLRPEKMPNSSARGSTQIFGPRKLSTFRPETMLARSVKQKLGRQNVWLLWPSFGCTLGPRHCVFGRQKVRPDHL